MQSLDEHRIVSHGCGRIDHCVQHLIIAGGRQTECLANRFLFCARVAPPPALKVENRGIALGEAVGGGVARRFGVLRLR